MKINSAGVYKTTAEIHGTKQPEIESNLRSFREAQDATYKSISNIPGVKNTLKLLKEF